MKVNANALKQALSLLLTQDNTVMTIKTSDEGWSMIAMDPSKVSMAQVTLTPEAFEEYVATDSFSVDPEKFLKALDGKGQMVEFELSGGQAILKGNHISTRVSLCNPPDAEPRIPPLDAGVSFIMDAGPLKQVVKALDEMMSMTVMVDETQIIFEGYNEAGAGTRLEIPTEECVAAVGEGRAIYGLAVLKPFIKTLPNDAELEIEFDTDYPIVVKYKMDGAEFTWLGAPWIEDGIDG